MESSKIKTIVLSTILGLVFLLTQGIAPMPPTASAGENSQYLIAKSKKKNKKKSKNQPSTPANHLSPKRQSKVISQSFKTPPAIKKAVDFWKMVYTKYDRNFEIFHDTENLGVVYSVLDFTDLYENPELDRRGRLAVFRPRMEEEETRIKELLLSIHEKQYQPERMSKEEKRIFDLFKDDANPDKFIEAATEKRIRAQTGIKNKFVEAIRISGGYIEEFEDIFMSYGLPIELTRMAFVESMFNIKARSKVGASGVWQFMPATGRIYGLTLNSLVDERNDPFLAAHAAARLLKSNYEALGTWPLAINAYNSGRATMRRAVNAMGSTEIANIILYYRGGIYGFASRNFYPSFLAALEIANNYPKYFGKIPRDPKLEFDTYVIKNPVLMEDLAITAGVSLMDMEELNPHFSIHIYNGRKKIPSGYSIKIPKGTVSKFSEADVVLATQKKRP